MVKSDSNLTTEMISHFVFANYPVFIWLFYKMGSGNLSSCRWTANRICFFNYAQSFRSVVNFCCSACKVMASGNFTKVIPSMFPPH